MDLRALLDAARPDPGREVWRSSPIPYCVSAAVAMTTCVVLLNLLLVGEVSYFFDLCFVVLWAVVGLMVRPRDVWSAALLPPAVLVGTVGFLALLSPHTVAESDDGFVQALITGIVTHSGALLGAYVVYGLALWTGLADSGVSAWDEAEHTEDVAEAPEPSSPSAADPIL